MSNTDPVQRLARLAYMNVVERLEHFGNVLSTAHGDALAFQALIFAMKAYRQLPGRHQVSLAPGIGKSEGIVGFVKAVHKLHLKDIGVLVATSKVEELCTLKRKLIEVGVPAHRIGVHHSHIYIRPSPLTTWPVKSTLCPLTMLQSHLRDMRSSSCC